MVDQRSDTEIIEDVLFRSNHKKISYTEINKLLDGLEVIYGHEIGLRQRDRVANQIINNQ